MTRPDSEPQIAPDKIAIELLVDPAQMEIIRNAAYDVNKDVAEYMVAKAVQGARHDTVAYPRD